MAELRASLSRAGFTRVATLLQSGNVIFDSNLSDTASIERQVEAIIAAEFAISTEVVARNQSCMSEIVTANPFSSMADDDPSHLVVLFTKQAVDEVVFRTLQLAIKGSEFASFAAGHIFMGYPDGIGESKLTPAVIDRALGQRATARNWNTILKLRDA
jgi:uncharacterized protein (DUF1697 family)